MSYRAHDYLRNRLKQLQKHEKKDADCNHYSDMTESTRTHVLISQSKIMHQGCAKPLVVATGMLTWRNPLCLHP